MMLKIAAAGIAFVMVSAPAASGAQNNDAAVLIRKQFDDCVMSAVGNIAQKDTSADPNLAAEQAFVACQTEERAIAAFMKSHNTPASQIETVLIAIRLQIKQSVRKMKAEAEAFTKMLRKQ